MSRIKKIPVVWTEDNEERAFIATWTSQGNPRLFDTAADVSPAIWSNVTFPGSAFSALADENSSADDICANEPTSEKSANDKQNTNGNQVVHKIITSLDSIMDPSKSMSHTEYIGPMDEESAKARMGDALYLYEWNLLVCSYLILRCTIGIRSSNSADHFRFLRADLVSTSLLAHPLMDHRSLVVWHFTMDRWEIGLQILLP